MAKKEVKNNKNENSKNKKSFVKDFKAELKKVNWPTSKQLLNNTVAVITIVLITAAIVFVLDFTFETINRYSTNKVSEVITKIKENEVESNNSQNITEETENNIENNAE